MDSLWCEQVWHMGELAFPILFRYFLSGMWPILSCTSMAACSRGSRSVSLQNLGDDVDGLMPCRRGYLGDFVNWVAVSPLTFHAWVCLTVDLLVLNCPLHVRGSWLSGLESPLAAFFASSSALSFSLIPSCPGVHHISRALSLCFPCNSSILSCSWSTRCWPRAPFMYSSAHIVAWLSAPMTAASTNLSCLMSSAAKVSLITLASYTVCWHSSPMCFLSTRCSSPFLNITATAPTFPSMHDPSE